MTKEEITRHLKQVNDKYRNNLFRVYTGDMIENGLKDSIGHGYDLDSSDPQFQRDEMANMLKEVNEHLYGKEKFNKITAKTIKDCLCIGCCGNHEYRTRKSAGIWLDKDIYEPAKVLSLGIHGLIEIKVVNPKLKLSRVFNVYVSHRPSKTNATSLEGILRSCRKKKADIPGVDVFVFGHYHRRVIEPDIYYDRDSGKVKKLMYVVNPSPLANVEYAELSGYSPLEVGYSVEIFLPLDPNKEIYGIV